MKKSFLFISILFLINNVYSQSLLWKITGNGLKTPSYLYGTIHIQDKRVFSFDTTVTNAFNSCDAFAMEILLSKVKPETLKKATIMKKGSLKELMSEDDYKLVAKVFHEKTGANILLYDKMKPFFLSSQIEQADMPKDMDEALDLYFYKLAEKQGKSTFGVEKFEQQVAAIDKVSLKDQIKMLIDAVKDTSKDDFSDLLNAYLNFNLNKLMELTSKDTTLPGNFAEAFLINRNKVMAKSIKKLTKKHKIFVAVGAAHLPGDKGVIKLLRDYGFTVEPVKFKFNYKS